MPSWHTSQISTTTTALSCTRF